MTVHFSDGFESNDFSAWTSSSTLGGDMSIATSSVRAFAGSYSAKVHIENAAAGDYARLLKEDAMDKGSGSHIWISGRFFFPTGFEAEAKLRLILIQEWGGFWKSVCVAAMNTNRELLIWDHFNDAEYTQDTPIQVPINQWVGIETHIYVHNTEGYYELWQDGVKIIEQTGIDTLSTNNWKRAWYGCCSVDASWTGPDEFWFDECYVQDEQKIPVQVGPIRFNPLNLRRFGGF